MLFYFCWQNLQNTVFLPLLKKINNDQVPIQSNSAFWPRHQMGKERIQFRRHEIRTARAESQEDSSFPVDGLQATLNKITSHRQTRNGRTLKIIINHHRSIAFERSVINYWGLKPVLRAHNPSPYVLLWFINIQVIWSAWMTSNASMYQKSKHIHVHQDPTLRWHKMSTQQQNPN